MSVISSIFGGYPGIGAMVESLENQVLFGNANQLKWTSANIYSGAIDSGNSPTYRLRPGLLMGYSTTLGQWTNYSPTATDGSEVARGILVYGMRMQDVLTGVNVNRFYAICTGGNVLASKLFGLDYMARVQMAYAFTFDDALGAGDGWYPTPRFQAKTTAYTIVTADNGTEFTNVGATGTVAFTLPTLANGLHFRFRVVADFAVSVASAEGTNMVAFNNASASSVAFSTGGSQIGGGVWVYANPAATKWYVQNISAGANTVTVA